MIAPDPLAALLAEHDTYWADGVLVGCGCGSTSGEVDQSSDDWWERSIAWHRAHLAAVLRDAGYEHGPTARAEVVAQAEVERPASMNAQRAAASRLHDGMVRQREEKAARAARLREHDGGTQ